MSNKYGIIWMKEIRKDRMYRGLYRTSIDVEACDMQIIYLNGELDVEVDFHYFPADPTYLDYAEVVVHDITVVHHGIIMLNFDPTIQEQINRPNELVDIQNEILGYIPDYMAERKDQDNEGLFLKYHYKVSSTGKSNL